MELVQKNLRFGYLKMKACLKIKGPVVAAAQIILRFEQTKRKFADIFTPE